MASNKLIQFMAESAYETICSRASKMVNEAFPGLSNDKMELVQAGIAAGVTATIKSFVEAGLLKADKND